MILGRIRLADACHGRDNNLNLIRMTAALAVLVSHAWPITLGAETIQPLETVLGGYELGTLAVFVFFSLSGFLIARSFERQPTLRTWLAARFLRLIPGLAVMLILTVIVLGPLVTDLPIRQYIRDPGTHSYVFRNLTLAWRQATLPGVFDHQPLDYEVNGSLWTLWYEVLCYTGVMLMGLLGAFRAWRPLVGVALVYGAANVAVVVFPDGAVVRELRILLSLAMPFACGVAFYLCRAWLPLNPLLLVGLIAGTVIVRHSPLYAPAFALTLSYAVFLMAFLPGGAIRRYNALGDYSYGVYIYAWPLQQTMVYCFGPLGPLGNIEFALPAVLLMAWLSWTFIEKPALAWARHSDPASRPGRAPAPAASASGERAPVIPEGRASRHRGG